MTFDKIFTQKIGELGTRGLWGTPGGTWPSTHKHRWAGGRTGGHHDGESGHGHVRGVVGPGWAGVPGGCATFSTLCPLLCHFPPRQPAQTVRGRKRLSLPSAGSGGFRARPAPCARPCPCPHCPTAAPSPPRRVPGHCSSCQPWPWRPVTLPRPRWWSLLGSSPSPAWHWGGSGAGQAQGMSPCPLAWAGGLSPLTLCLRPCRLPAFPGFRLQPGRGGQAPDGILRGGETGGPRGQALCTPGVGLAPPGPVGTVPRAPPEVMVPRELGDAV